MASNTDTQARKLTQREFVMGFFSGAAPCFDMLTGEQFARAYLLGDGFGPGMDVETANEQCWDRSHVRDSSPEAMQRIQDQILTDLRPDQIGEAFDLIWDYWREQDAKR